jgi:tryptophanyl-tRNA synthetase
VRRTDPGTPEVCNIYHLHKAFNDEGTVEHVAIECRTAGWGCLDCKKVLMEGMMRELTPIRERALELEAHPEIVTDALAAGAMRIGEIARSNMAIVRETMGLR